MSIIEAFYQTEKDIQTILLEEFKNSVEKDSDHSSLQKFKESNSDDVQHAQKNSCPCFIRTWKQLFFCD